MVADGRRRCVLLELRVEDSPTLTLGAKSGFGLKGSEGWQWAARLQTHEGQCRHVIQKAAGQADTRKTFKAFKLKTMMHFLSLGL